MLLLPTSGVLSDGWSLSGSGSGSGSEVGWDQSKTETGGDINGLYIPSELLRIFEGIRALSDLFNSFA